MLKSVNSAVRYLLISVLHYIFATCALEISIIQFDIIVIYAFEISALQHKRIVICALEISVLQKIIVVSCAFKNSGLHAVYHCYVCF